MRTDDTARTRVRVPGTMLMCRYTVRTCALIR
jgi:hypothetical protein